jgi:hypothetical protein
MFRLPGSLLSLAMTDVGGDRLTISGQEILIIISVNIKNIIILSMLIPAFYNKMEINIANTY